MASTIKVDNVQNQPGTNIVNKCSTTVNIGAASDNIRSAGNNLQAAYGGNLISQSGTDITLGASGDTVALASGASQTGFGRTGTVDWVTTPKVTGDSPVTAATGSGYFLNTTAGEITINLPAGAAGSIVSMADYAETWQTNKVTVAPNGAEKIGGVAETAALSTQGQSVTFVYVDSTQGWVNIQDSTSNVRGGAYIVASGGNQSPGCGIVSGNYKTHIFTGPGTFCVSAGAGPLAIADYLVVAGGGGGGNDAYPASRIGGGGGAGGFRISNTTCLAVPKMSPLAVCATGQSITASPYPITVGGGGTAGTGTEQPTVSGGRGDNSVFACITSTGGGAGAGHTPGPGGLTCETPGGSGGAFQGGQPSPQGLGNTPPTSPPQGQNAGDGGAAPTYVGGGGGGAGGVGTNQSGGIGGSGGPGSFLDDDAIGPTAPSYGTPGPEPVTRYFSGGGGTAGPSPTAATGGAGGGGGAGGYNGTVNTGGGAGGVRGGTGGAGGSGIVIIRYKFQ